MQNTSLISEDNMDQVVNIFAGNFSSLVSFQPFHDEIGLPFPLNSGAAIKYSFVALYLLILIEGSRLRKVIFSYMMCPEVNQGPINVLIWLDQLNGINLFLTTSGDTVIFQLKLLISFNPFKRPQECTLRSKF